MTHSELVMAAWSWLLRDTQCGVAFREYKSSRFSMELPDVIGFDLRGISYIVECKVSRADFLADANKPFRKNPELGMGSQRYYCCPSKLITADEIPRGWGLVYVNDDGVGWPAHDPYSNPDGGIVRYFERNRDAEYLVMYSALKRMDIRGSLEQIYEKIAAPVLAVPRGVDRAAEGERWVRKGRPNQVVIVRGQTAHVVNVESSKTGAPDAIKKDKFYREYEKENQ